MSTYIKQIITTTACLLALSSVAFAQTGELRRVVISSGTVKCSSTEYSITGTTGETVTGDMSSANYQAGCGYDQIGNTSPTEPLSCCVGLRGNVNGDENDETDISDLTAMVDFMFRGGAEPVCMEEADINGDGENDISDLTAFVDFMFREGAAPVACSSISPAPSAKINNQIVLYSYVSDEGTRLVLNSNVNLRGIQLKLLGPALEEVIFLADDRLEVPFGYKENTVRMGILDLEGIAMIESGSQELVMLPGEYHIVSAVVADMNHRTQSITLAPLAKEQESLPDDYDMGQNYPNPYNPTTTIGFSLPKASRVTLEVFNITGQRVKTLVDTELSAGHHEVQWDSRNTNGNKVSSGVYFYRITANDFHKTKKMLLLK